MAFDKKLLSTLLDQLDTHDEAYYTEDKPTISDPEYDGIKDRVRTLAAEFKPKADSKSECKLAERARKTLERVGAPSSGTFPELTHEVPMMSLNKVNLPEEFDVWLAKCSDDPNVELLMTEKMDGISISLKYVKDLVSAGTRGDGNVGFNITPNVKKMHGVPTSIGITGHIRGEIVLLKSDWKKHLPLMKNTRQGAGGVAKRSDGKECEHLTVISYTVEGKDFATEKEAFDYIKSLGFRTPNYRVGKAKDAKKMWQEYMDTVRDTLDYDIDGLVFHINDRAVRFALGEEGNRPKGSIAFKFEAPEARTLCTEIIDQVGDTGIITPVVVFNPVELLGANIGRASLHNYEIIEKLGVNIGAEILVSRANDVIPHVKEVTKPNNGYYRRPEKCPACGTATVRNGAYLRCPNKLHCPPQVIGRLNKWIKELGILDWGESILSKLIAANKVTDVADMYRLTVSDIATLDRMSDKVAQKLLAELGKYRSITLENFVGGLCINGVATSTVKSLVDEGHDTLAKLRALTIHQLEKIDGFGEIKAGLFYNGLKENADRIDDIVSAGVTIKQRASGSLNGISVCFTGTSKLPRKTLQSMCEAAGGEAHKDIKKETTYLVQADPNSESAKSRAAKKNGTKVISEEDFLAMIK